MSSFHFEVSLKKWYNIGRHTFFLLMLEIGFQEVTECKVDASIYQKVFSAFMLMYEN